VQTEKPEIHLKLTVADLNPQFQVKPPPIPKFYHFNENLTALQFQEATLITYTGPKGDQVIMKDLYNRLLK
jgi:hypothetical protein